MSAARDTLPCPPPEFENDDDARITGVDTADDDLYATLVCAWPVERPSGQRQSEDVEACLALGLLYREPVGHGWVRIGLTESGRAHIEECRAGDEAWARAEFARIDARPPRHLRRLTPTTCEACGHEFLADSTSLAPEGCPECGHCPEDRS